MYLKILKFFNIIVTKYILIVFQIFYRKKNNFTNLAKDMLLRS